MSDAEDIAAALAEVGVTHCLRKEISGPSSPYDPAPANYEYHDITGYEYDRQVIDMNGTLVQKTQRTIAVGATGAAPAKQDEIAVGVASADVSSDTVWSVITEVRTIQISGGALIFEVDLAAGGV